MAGARPSRGVRGAVPTALVNTQHPIRVLVSQQWLSECPHDLSLSQLRCSNFWAYVLICALFILVLSLFTFCVLTLAFQLFTGKLCLQVENWGCVILREIDFHSGGSTGVSLGQLPPKRQWHPLEWRPFAINAPLFGAYGSRNRDKNIIK